MKTNIFIKVLPALACCLVLVSCSDFLDQQPKSQITPSDYYQSEVQVQTVANKFYEDVLPYHRGAGYGTFAYDNGTDNQTGAEGDAKYVKGQWKTSNDNSNWNWENVRNVNYQLDTIMSNYNRGRISGSNAKIRQYIGELYFFRAYSYFKFIAVR